VLAGQLERVRGLTDVKLRYKPGRPEVRLVVDKARAGSFGFSVREVGENLHAMIRGLRATYFSTESSQVETVARLSEEDRRTLDDIHRLTLITRQGELVPIDQITKFDLSLTPSEIWRKNKERIIQVSANRERMALSTAVEKVAAQLQGVSIPIGYHYEFGGDYEKLLENERQFAFAFAAMLGLVYIILACFFESYSQPFIILLTVPLATIGTMPALWVTGTAVNMGVYIGLLMLGGIVVGNAIILIDRLNATRRTRSLFRSVLKVGQERFKPIMMTSLTTILGLLPLVFQKGEASDLWRPLALTVISGLAFSTMLTLVVIPCCYILLVDFQNLAVKLKESRLGLLDVAVDWWKKRQKAAAALPARPVPAFLRNRTR